MCGICGFVDFELKSDEIVLEKMTQTLNHRGPDDFGTRVYERKQDCIGFGQTRLSIIDLSPLGHQPMEYNQYSIVFNGEIYNFQEIKSELVGLGHEFESSSDTEVILHAFAEWGNSCVEKFIGMFAFVIFDRPTNRIRIFRDRAGVKPLYYYQIQNLFLFGSELKAFHEHPKFIKKVDINAVHQYMDFGYIPAPYCIFENCYKLNPGHYLELDLNNQLLTLVKYWDIKDYYKKPKLNICYNDALIELEELLKSAFEYRMVADVPVGVFLSGGFDSTAVTAILQKDRKEKLKTFTIGFKEGNNEAPFAKEIASYLGTDHTEYYCTTKEAQDIIPKLPFFYDEPFADSSAIPTTLVSQMARKKVTVALSADAGDEIFAGYTIYKTFLRNLSAVKKVPAGLRKFMAVILKFLNLFVPGRSNLKHKIQTLSSVLSQQQNKIYQELYRSYFKLNDNIKKDILLADPIFRKTIFDDDFKEFTKDLTIPMAIDYSIYLQNDILTKVDRATMSTSLEGREPFLDQRIIEYVAQLPLSYKYDGKTQKRILKDIVYKYIPKELMDRPKTGFTIPIYEWLRNDLKYLIDEYLSTSSVQESQVFNVKTVEQLKENFLNEKLDDETIIWKLLQFQMWYKQWA